MLDWLLQSAQPCDSVTVEREGQLSTFDMRETGINPEFPTISTSFPQKSAPWRIVFHMEPVITRHLARQSAPLPFPLPEVQGQSGGESLAAPQISGMDWPAAARAEDEKRTAPRPLKLGVTALCRALDGAQTLPEAAEEEEEQLKRLPYEGPRPRLLASLPAMPAFLEPPPRGRRTAAGRTDAPAAGADGFGGRAGGEGERKNDFLPY